MPASARRHRWRRESGGEALRAAAASSEAFSDVLDVSAAVRQRRAERRQFARSSAPRRPASSSRRDRGSVSSARSIGTCNSEQDGASCTRSLPRLATMGSSRSSMPARSARQMLRPSMTPSDSTRSLRRLRQTLVELLGRAHEIEMQPGDRQRQRGVEVVAEAAEIGRQHDLELRHRLGDFARRRGAAPAARRHRDRARGRVRRSAPIPRRRWRVRAGLRCRPAAAGRAATAGRSRRPCSWRVSGT